MKEVKIALLGFGNVGTGVWQVLNFNTSQIKNRSNYDIKITKILVNDINKKREVAIPTNILTNNFNDILEDDSIDIVVELIGGATPALEYMLAAMKRKKHVVTANKLCVAKFGDILFKTSKEEEVFFYYEASVGGGIPVIREIQESLTGNNIDRIVGIVNGTANYILTKMTSDNMTFDNALKEAQEKGFAEADPTDDIEAFDSVYKLAIISSLSFESKVIPENILREGITKISDIDIKYAKKFGYRIKLLAVGQVVQNSIEVRVHPAFVSESHTFAHVKDAYNAVYINGNAVGDLFLHGKGAGDLPTGSAVVGDILSILRNKMNYHAINRVKKDTTNLKILSSDEYESEYYIRLNIKNKVGILGELGLLFAKNNISISYLTQDVESDDIVQAIFMTYKCKHKNIRNFLKSIPSVNDVNFIENIIRIEDFNK